MKMMGAFMTIGLRLMILLFSLAVLAILMFAHMREAFAADLRTVSIINSDVLKAGDIFDGLPPEKAAYVLGPAPQPGTEMTLNARTLMRVALTLDFPWQPGSVTDQVTIRRAATTVSDDIIRNIVDDAIRQQGIEGRFEVSYTGSMPNIIMPGTQEQTAEVLSFTSDPRTDSFQAVLVAPSKETELIRATVTGKIQRYVSVPVLKTSLRSGDIIGPRDIIWIDMPASDIQPGILLKEENITGHTPKRLISAGKPLQDRDIEKPQMVTRGDFITIIYQSGSITLTAKGKSLQDGAEGDFVRVVNTNSNKNLEGIVSGDRQVTITQ